MGGEGSGRKPDVIKMAREQFQSSHINFQGTPLIITNYSGLKPGAKKTEELDGTADNLSGSARIVGIITHTSAIPPTAANYQIGTLYIQYTA